MNTHQIRAIQALNNMKGDDLARARHAFQDCSAQEMNSLYGQSGKTRRQILNEYEDHERKINETIEWVKAQRN